MEHRLGHRVPVREAVRVRTAAGEFDAAVITDISLSGAFIHTRMHPPNLAPIYVTFADPRRPSNGVSLVKAQVVRSCPDGFGIEWSQFAPGPVMKRVIDRAAANRLKRFREEGQPA
jgi:hypothetical protein